MLRFEGSAAAPAWVAADLAFAARGTLDESLFSAADAQALERVLATARQVAERASGEAPDGSECDVEVRHHTDWLHTAPNGSLEDLLTHASSVEVGVVTGLRAGFFRGRLGTLFRLQNDRQPEDGELFVFLPAGRIQVGGAGICAVGTPRAEVPEPGRRMVVFVYRDDRIGDARVLLPDDEEFLFETGDDRLSAPAGYGIEGLPMAFDALLEEVRRTASQVHYENLVLLPGHQELVLLWPGLFNSRSGLNARGVPGVRSSGGVARPPAGMEAGRFNG